MTKFVQIDGALRRADSIHRVEAVSGTPPRVYIRFDDASGFLTDGTLEEWAAKLSDGNAPSDHIVTTVFIPEGSIATGQWVRSERILNRRVIDAVAVPQRLEGIGPKEPYVLVYIGERQYRASGTIEQWKKILNAREVAS